jgi:hypothetical protein
MHAYISGINFGGNEIGRTVYMPNTYRDIDTGDMSQPQKKGKQSPAEIARLKKLINYILFHLSHIRGVTIYLPFHETS